MSCIMYSTRNKQIKQCSKNRAFQFIGIAVRLSQPAGSFGSVRGEVEVHTNNQCTNVAAVAVIDYNNIIMIMLSNVMMK